MSHYLVELYTPNAAWKACSTEERQQFLNGIAAAMGNMSNMGVEMLTLSATEPAIACASEHHFLGIWHFANPQARDALLAGIEASGWYNYFDHVNAASSSGSFTQHLAELVAA